jgi:hypothetical protein
MCELQGPPANGARLLFVVTEDWYFWSHRLDLALEAQKAGYEVWLAARFSGHQERIEALGIHCMPLPVARGLEALFKDLKSMLLLAWMVWRLKPAIVHAVALKPIFLCALAAKLPIVSPQSLNSLILILSAFPSFPQRYFHGVFERPVSTVQRSTQSRLQKEESVGDIGDKL